MLSTRSPRLWMGLRYSMIRYSMSSTRTRRWSSTTQLWSRRHGGGRHPRADIFDSLAIGLPGNLILRERVERLALICDLHAAVWTLDGCERSHAAAGRGSSLHGERVPDLQACGAGADEPSVLLGREVIERHSPAVDEDRAELGVHCCLHLPARGFGDARLGAGCLTFST